MSQEKCSSELRIVVQQQGLLPSGYIERHCDTLAALQSKLELLPELAFLLFTDDTTADLNSDDPNGVGGEVIPPEPGFPFSVRISAAELRDPQQRNEFIQLLCEEFADTLRQLPQVYLLFQSPLDD